VCVCVCVCVCTWMFAGIYSEGENQFLPEMGELII
jgi:hypothetical protein